MEISARRCRRKLGEKGRAARCRPSAYLQEEAVWRAKSLTRRRVRLKRSDRARIVPGTVADRLLFLSWRWSTSGGGAGLSPGHDSAATAMGLGSERDSAAAPARARVTATAKTSESGWRLAQPSGPPSLGWSSERAPGPRPERTGQAGGCPPRRRCSRHPPEIREPEREAGSRPPRPARFPSPRAGSAGRGGHR